MLAMNAPPLEVAVAVNEAMKEVGAPGTEGVANGRTATHTIGHSMSATRRPSLLWGLERHKSSKAQPQNDTATT